MNRRSRWAFALVAAVGLAGCSTTGTPEATASPQVVKLITHDSFYLPDEVLTQFTAETGIGVQVLTAGDAGAMVNQLVLTKGAPLGDVVFGVDNTFATRALDKGVIAPLGDVSVPADAKAHALPGDDGRLVAVDYADVCVNVDTTWFAEHRTEPPATLDDLVDPAYRGLFVTPSPVTSSPGFAFLLATIAAKGDGWHQYWKDLGANGVQVAAGWSDAYVSSFTAGGGGGDRPVVLSYDTSPPFTVPEAGKEPTTAALLGTCVRQTEYAGVLAGAKNPQGAAALVEFLLSDTVQKAIPEAMYMYPVSTSVTLPDEWVAWAPLASEPFSVDPAQIAANRQQWLDEWADLGVG
ncbi:MAG: thiamine ABC transporter substrate-binding protein [Micrococcales bacterium]|nr:thiamine ABC transporter substrate-binding protein [Micrococcales bacterium]MCL2667032.1 thiamine ABC transporter substrate-binding protein [Micrococcales bacterium]